ncbi:uncharacterized protein BCR38DRAFT_512974 [Pseudomassariella vexata]|uniref:Glycosyl transferase family 1 domain-containing protein n=1 Tax=Pseudomassariella vexata TaxID=1141098 RepID=A0A1Y2E0A6_9PEZI|nr:uncharacterized protein BCR38DRAFT_512974 [Pseudomassariella vexata]ORY64794.1 hypothetical protein BCR38DRAFT_512974 [Pseudomassariella vexata]
MAAELAPGIVVLNKKYFPKDSISAAQVGATSFALSVLRVLSEAKILRGVVLYQRDERLTQPHCALEPDLYDGVKVVTVSFHFRMSTRSITRSLLEAYLTPIVYYQTDTLLEYHPQGLQFCVTHHGPFVSDFKESFTRSLTELAFGGDPAKIEVLEKQQKLGVDRLIQDNFGSVLAHSAMQQHFLEGQGLGSQRFKRLRPPIGVPPCSDPDLLPDTIKDFVSQAEILLFTAVARLDYFKNVDLLVQAGLELLKRGVPVKVLVVGDPESDDSRRRSLLKLVPVEQRQHFLVLAKLPKDDLYALFSATRGNGIFICPSRYETLGITPLEAAASGVATLITDSPKVEASRYFPAGYRVTPSAAKIAAKVQVIRYDGVRRWGEMIEAHVRLETSLNAFHDDLLAAWKDLSRSNMTSRTSENGLVGRKGVKVENLISTWLQEIRTALIEVS